MTFRSKPALRAMTMLLLGGSAVAAVAQPPGGFPPGTITLQRRADDPSLLLSQYLRTLSDNPRDVNALIGAGRASLAMGDVNAALNFLGRAEAIAPQDGRVKAALGAVLVQKEQPHDALKLFAQAAALGVPMADFAGDRGLAFDLTGDTVRAQADYRAALAWKKDDEITRRLALSTAIGGNRAGAIAILDPLMRKQDKAAWRASTFVLAMTGDAPAAVRRANQLMVPRQAAAMTPYLERLGGLSPAAKAAAVHFGRFPSARGQQQLAAATPSASSPARAAGAVAGAQAVGRTLSPVGPAFGRPAGESATVVRPTVVATQARPTASASTPIAMRTTTLPILATAERTAAPIRAPALAGTGATGTRVATLSSVPRAAASPGLPPPPAPVRMVTAIPATGTSTTANGVRASVAAPGFDPRVAPLPASVTSPSPSTARVSGPVQIVALDRPTLSAGNAPAAVAPSRATADVPVADAIPGTTPELQMTSPAAATGVAPAPAVTLPMSSAGGGAVSRPIGETGVAMVEATTVTPAAAPTSIAPAAAPAAVTASATSSVQGAQVRERTPTATTAPAASAPHRTPRTRAAAVPDAPAEKAKSRTAGTEVAVADGPDVDFLIAEAPAPAKGTKAKTTATAASERDARRAKGKDTADDATDGSTKNAKGKAARTAAKEAKQDAKDKTKAVPERYWVQVAGGANKTTLPKAWDALKAQHGALLKGHSAYTTPLRFTNRLLVGPFKSDDEAQAFVNKATAGGFSTFSFKSAAGQEVEKLPVK